MMKLKMNKDQLEKLIKKYYREEMDFDGEVQLRAEREYDMRDYYFEPIVTLIGNMELGGEMFQLEKNIAKEEINDIIKFYFEKEGYKVGAIYHQVTEDYHGDTAKYTGTEIEVKQKIKEKGVI